MEISGRITHRCAGVVVGAFALCSLGCAGATAPAPTGPAPEGAVQIGYGASDPQDLATSVSSLKASEIEGSHATTMVDLLKGRIPGLEVESGPGGPVLRIRGVSSFMGGDEPLVVVDGVAISQPGFGSALNRINPRDVVRVDVLKGPAASIYGSRGGNGVIVITTRRPG